MKNKIAITKLVLFYLLLASSCSKTGFLSAKPDNSLVVPNTVADYQSILDNDLVMNGASAGMLPRFMEDGADNYYIPSAVLASRNSPLLTAMYTWATDPYLGETVTDWNYPYTSILYANSVLDGLALLPQQTARADWKNARGSALFYRAHVFYQLAQVFAPAFNSSSATTDPGIPLKLTADVNEKITRATVRQTYERIIGDLKEATNLLPTTALYPTRPSGTACLALLARTYQTMRLYDSALHYADACLTINNTLMDYNDYPVLKNPFPRFNPEVIFHCIPQQLATIYGSIDTVLLNTYDSSDLRPSHYFNLTNNYFKFIGSYDGSVRLFAGLATDEIYLIRAECMARAGKANAAMSDLNTLLAKRFAAGKFVPLVATSAEQALSIILSERRKELCFRGLRWTDIRRLNQEGANIGITRMADGQTYTLAPNSPKWVWPIPNDVLSFNPGMQQNPR